MARRFQPRDMTWWGSFGLGAVAGCGATGAVVIGLLIFHGALYDWQTLVSGFVALLGALGTVVWIQFQIEESRIQENERRERRHYAARAAMPAALSGLIQYTRGYMDVLRAIPLPDADELVQVPEGWTVSVPVVPMEAVMVLRECIESAPPAAMEKIAGVLETLQVINSRINNLVRVELPDQAAAIAAYNMREHIADALDFYVTCSAMLAYARRDAEEINAEVTHAEISTQAFFFGFRRYPGLSDMLAHRYAPAQ